MKKKFNLIIIPILFLYAFMLFYKAETVSITDDARYYMEAAKNYSSYFTEGYKGFRYFDKNFIDRYWMFNNEHPSFAKLLMAGGYLFFHKLLGVNPEFVTFRYGISIMALILLLFIFDFTRRVFSLKAAVFASLFFIFLPRTFFHARVATLDFTVGAASFIFVYSYYRAFTSKFWTVMTGITFGLALATKLNAPFMVVPVVIHYLIIKREDIFKKRSIKALFPRQFISMLIISMPLFFMIWPWMWHDTVNRMSNYISFHTKHYGILMYYLGEIYREPRPPFTAPLVMTLMTVPVMVLFFSAVLPFIYRKKDSSENSPLMLVTLAALFSVFPVIISPVFYSGVKLFQPLFPFLAIMAGLGLALTLEKAEIKKREIKYGFAVLIFIPQIIGFISVSPNHLSYYNEISGGTKGALIHGMERHYYDLFYNDISTYFNEKCSKQRCDVCVMPNGGEYIYPASILKKGKELTNNFRYISNCETADYLILTHEYRWESYPHLLKQLKNEKAVYTKKEEEVPLFTIFKLK